MSMMTRRLGPIPIAPNLRSYAWGDPAFIPNLLGLPATGKPYAEAWFGAHPLAPSSATIEGEAIALDALIAQRADEILGPRVASRFGGLPYLLKILAASRPLSIQVHPDRAHAEEGFARDDSSGLALDAAERSYKDPFRKHELLVALTEFDALCGFRPIGEIDELLSSAPELRELLPPLREMPGGVKELLERYFDLPSERLVPALVRLVTRLEEDDARSGLVEGSVYDWLLRAHRELSEDETPDRGLVFLFLLSQVHLDPGQAIFLPAGVPHAYLRGAGVEIMANSDNVLRAGLTPKHVEPEELLRVVRFDAAQPPVIEAVEVGAYKTRVYASAAPEFDLARLNLADRAEVWRESRGPETLLAMPESRGARARVVTEHETLDLGRGQACLVPDGTRYRVVADGDVQVYAASVPGPRDDSPRFRGHRPTPLAFGTSGLRGLVEDITDLEAYLNTRGFLRFLVASGDAVPGSRVALASDLRPSSESILRAVTRAVTDAGMRSLWCGLLPTPALTLFGLEEGIPSIMVTGSHIPFDRNGIKFNKSTGEVLKSDEPAILEAVERARRLEYAKTREVSLFEDDGRFKEGEAGTLPPLDGSARELYVRRYVDTFAEKALEGMRLAFFAHTAVGREIVPEILRGLGAEVHAVGRSEHFVAIDTEAISRERLDELQALADEVRAEIGAFDAIVSTDGDSDRPMLLGFDEGGGVRFFGGDVLGALVADALDADAIAVPISASDGIDLHFAGRVPVVRTRIGSPWVIAAMETLEGERRVGWEANGGFLTGSPIALERGVLAPLPTRDAVLPIVTALHAASRADQPLAELFAALPRRFAKAGLLDQVPTAQSRELLARFGPGDARVRRVIYDGDEVRWEGFEGQPQSAGGALLERFVALRAQLEQHFDEQRGFDKLASIDCLDGLRLRFTNGDVAHVRPSGNAPQLRIYAVSDSEQRADAIVAMGLEEPEGLLRELLGAARDASFVEAIRANIARTADLFASDGAAQVIGTVSGSERARSFWQEQLDAARPAFGARAALSFHEDLPVNQAFGLLLLWQRLRPELREGEGALVAFVFGEGTRSTPLTEAESGQKPAIQTFVSDTEGEKRRWLPTVEVALRYFAPVEAFLRRSGFEGVVVKWGDEVQIPTRDLSGSDPLFEGADVVRFVSMKEITPDDAANKDWVGVDTQNRVTAFIPRRPIADMEHLAERGIVQRQGKKLVGGINLGSIALSRALLDVLLEEFSAEVNDAGAERRDRPDLDPQLFTALCVAAIADAEARQEAWRSAKKDSAAIRDLESKLPGVLERLRAALDRFEERMRRPLRMVAMDFGDQYWGDVGQHAKLRELLMALRDEGASGKIARALAGIADLRRDERGNLLVGSTRLGDGVDVRGSVLIDAQIESGAVEGSVLIGTRARAVQAKHAFDVQSCADTLTLAPGSGAYKAISPGEVRAAEGERVTTVFLPEGEALMRVHEDTDLRDRRATYDVPILGNSLSFREAHELAAQVDPADAEQRRRKARAGTAR